MDLKMVKDKVKAMKQLLDNQVNTTWTANVSPMIEHAANVIKIMSLMIKVFVNQYLVQAIVLK